MHQTEISFFVDGLDENGTAFDTRTLSGSITDSASSTIQIGYSSNGKMFVFKILFSSGQLQVLVLKSKDVLIIYLDEFVSQGCCSKFPPVPGRLGE